MLTPGTMFGGRYRLDERIAGGGMGDVWRGTDEVLGRTVAVKVLLPQLLEEPGFAERFRGEARTMATINHPGVVDVYDYGNENGTAFLVMEYVEGDALSRTLSRVGRLTPARTMALVAQAADALHAAHVKGIVHRDVKPGNLLVRPNGTLVLTDFGIARAAGGANLTAVGSVLGTASYIAPEQASGQQATPLSDVYALGIVAYQCLSGHRPFEGDNPIEIAMKHVRDIPPPLPGDIPGGVCQVVERAMAKDPAARYPSAAAMAQVARQVATQLSGGGTATMAAAGPVAPVSGNPVSGAGAPVSGPGGLGAAAAGGTRMFTGAMGAQPVSGQPPVSGPPGGYGTAPTSPVTAGFGTPGPGGQYARGTAGVAPPPSPQETGYTYLQPGAGQAQQAPRSQGGAGGGMSDQNRTLILIAAGLLVLVVVIGAVAVMLLSGDDKKDQNQPVVAASSSQAASPTGRSSRTPSRTPTGSPTSAMINIDCKGLIGELYPVVQAQLAGKFQLDRQNVASTKRKNEVVDITPCQAHAGDVITVKVSNGPAGGPSNDASPQPSCSGQPGTCPSSKRS